MFLLPKRDVDAVLTMGSESEVVPVPIAGGFRPELIARPEVPPSAEGGTTRDVPLIRLAWARSGDKGDLFNVAVIARRAEYLPYIRDALTPQSLGNWYAHLFRDPERRRVERFEAPGLHALNFLVHESLDGGSTASARLDFVAKGMAQQLLEFPVPVPEKMAASLPRDAPDARPYIGAV
jgi:hypothetical protein